MVGHMFAHLSSSPDWEISLFNKTMVATRVTLANTFKGMHYLLLHTEFFQNMEHSFQKSHWSHEQHQLLQLMESEDSHSFSIHVSCSHSHFMFTFHSSHSHFTFTLIFFALFHVCTSFSLYSQCFHVDFYLGSTVALMGCSCTYAYISAHVHIYPLAKHCKRVYSGCEIAI